MNASGDKTETTANTAVALVLGSSPAPVPGTGLYDPEIGRLVSTLFWGSTAKAWYTYTQDTRPRGDWKGWYNSRVLVNSRFTITLPTIVIPKGQKEATGTITLTPIDNDIRGLYNTYDEFTIPWDIDPNYPKPLSRYGHQN